MSVQQLENLDDFRPVGRNWSIVGDVTSDRNTLNQSSLTSGTGILMNLPTEMARDNLFFDWEHGDIELELEYLMPKGSNSGIYLQGRYEIQMFDSWGVVRPTFSDAGGIYQRWNPDRPDDQRGFEGHAPLMNVSRAPGLWQRFQIRFQAPRFDGNGNKIANAKMVKVVHNGVVIHENVELTGPTRAAAFSDEAAMGPLMIQGDHGPVAVRNIRYRRFQPNRMTMSDVRFKYSEGFIESVSEIAGMTVLKEGEIDGIDWRVSEVDDQVAVTFDGNFHVPYSGTYQFSLKMDWVRGDPHDLATEIGGGVFVVDGRTVLTHAGREQTVSGEIDLEAGTHPFTLSYFKNRGGLLPNISLSVQGGGLPLQSLNSPSSWPSPPRVGSIFVVPAAEPALIRGFVNHDGEKKTHTIAVGHPSGVHYTMDLREGALLHVWKGDFLETTDMWHSRGTAQLAVPLGSVLTFSGRPTVALLAAENTAWPDSMGSNYTFNGYKLDEYGYPSFQYQLGGISVSDYLRPEHDGQHLVRELTIRTNESQSDASNYWIRVALGADISELADGSYSIDDKSYYVSIEETGGEKAVVRSSGDGQELLIPVSPNDGEVTVRYALIW